MRIVLSLLLIVFFSSLYAQIKLVSFDKPDRREYRAIVFHQVTDSISGGGENVIEYDIQANNPYGQLEMEVIGRKLDGSKIFKLEKESRKQDLESLGLKYNPNLNSSNVDLEAQSHYALDMNSNYAVIAYKLFLYGPYGGLSSNGRVSTIEVIDYKGKVVNKISNIPTDIYSVLVSEDGKYLFYAFGEPIEHAESYPEKSGFRIIDLSDNSLFYEKEAYRVKAIVANKKDITINVILPEGHFFYFFDKEAIALYEIDKKVLLASMEGACRLISGDTVSFSQLKRVR